MSASSHLDVFLYASQNYRIGAYVTLASLTRHLHPSQDTTIHLLSTFLEESSLSCVRSILQKSGKSVTLDYRQVNLSPFSEIHEKQSRTDLRTFPDAIYARLLIPSLFPDIEFGVYTDADILFQKDLAELSDLRDSDAPLFGVDDYGMDSLSHPGDTIDWKHFNLNPAAPYFNSGFLLMNLKHWPRESFIERCQQISRQTKLSMPDQSLLNIIFAEQWERLEPDWNRMCFPRHKEYAFPKKAANYHFIGATKPWMWPRRMSIGCVYKVHQYLSEIPREYIHDYRATRKPFPFFFLKSQLSRLLRGPLHPE